MEVKSYADVVSASKESGVPMILIAEAFNIKTPFHLQFEAATTSQELWALYNKIKVVSSKLRTEILKAILRKATTREELWKVWGYALPRSEVSEEALHLIEENDRIPGMQKMRTRSLPEKWEADAYNALITGLVRSVIENL